LYLGCTEFLTRGNIGPEEYLLLLRWLRLPLPYLPWSWPAGGGAEQGAQEGEGGEGGLGAGGAGGLAPNIYEKQYDLHGSQLCER